MEHSPWTNPASLLPTSMRLDTAGVVQSEEQIVRVMDKFMLEAGEQMPGTGGGGTDALTVALVKKIQGQ